MLLLLTSTRYHETPDRSRLRSYAASGRRSARRATAFFTLCGEGGSRTIPVGVFMDPLRGGAGEEEGEEKGDTRTALVGLLEGCGDFADKAIFFAGGFFLRREGSGRGAGLNLAVPSLPPRSSASV